MLGFLYQDKDGNNCLAKTSFTITILTCMGNVIYSTFIGNAIDYTGMSTLIGAVGAIYWGRSNTKATNVKTN